MNITTNIHPNIQRGALRAAAAATLCLAAAGASAACTANSGHFIGTRASVPHEGFSAGEQVNGGGANPMVFKDCDRSSGADLSIGTTLTYIGEIGGHPTFRTSDSSIGVQLRYRYLEASGFSGDRWSDWIYVSDTRRRFHAKSSYDRYSELSGLPIDVVADFIALRDIDSNASISVADLDPPFELQDHTYGQDLADALVTGFTIKPYVYASCGYTRSPPSTLALASTSVGNLKSEGDLGPAVNFSFAWRCVGGDDRPGGADFQFMSSKALGTSNGLLSVDGDASGVDMLVTMKDRTGKQMPVPLGTHWWASHHYGRGYPLPDVGSQDMQVRFRRNKDELKPGSASSTMTVRLSFF
ncbi:hypothetical protein [Stenotrophomonas sp. RAC2]|uniref:fimbrial protein n=1 Tax=Stenotrophomonas sp. RAC2 TaxID=3064902 RepID=UPI00272911BB|nr:hypothetical protein [Stenotrophomonas sp. RAC2]MDV9043866.1 hypothetical protein [Stenotrophomonas sp. RAC2]